MPYWDPKGAAEELFAERGALGRLGLHNEDSGEYFAGKWEDRNRFNVPGPFYGAETDTCCCGPLTAPGNVVIDDLGQELVWRQPRDAVELRAVLDAAWSDPFSGYAWDGDDHWTVESVREWWRNRGEVADWIDRRLRSERLLAGREAIATATSRSLEEFREYLDAGLSLDLSEYLFWLEEGRPREGEPLPRL